MCLSTHLRAIVGTGMFYSKNKVYKKLIEYIRIKKLVDADDRKLINCDYKLRKLLRMKQCTDKHIRRALLRNIWQ